MAHSLHRTAVTLGQNAANICSHSLLQMASSTLDYSVVVCESVHSVRIFSRREFRFGVQLWLYNGSGRWANLVPSLQIFGFILASSGNAQIDRLLKNRG